MAERTRSVPKTSDRLGRMLAIVPYLVQHPGSALNEVATRVRRRARPAPTRSRPPVHVRAPSVRPRRPDRRRRRRGRPHLDLDGRPLLPAAAAHEDRSARRLPPRNGAARPPRHAGRARAREGAREAAQLPRRGDARRGRGTDRDRAARASAGAPRSAARRGARTTSDSRSSTSPRRRGSGASARSTPKRSSRGWGIGTSPRGTWTRTRSVSSAPTGFGARRRPARRSPLAASRGAGRDLYSPTGEDVSVRLRLRPAARWIAEYYATTELEERARRRRRGHPSGTAARMGRPTPPACRRRRRGRRARRAPRSRCAGSPARRSPGTATRPSQTGLAPTTSASLKARPERADSCPEMTTIRTTCPRCGEVDMGPEAISLSVRSSGREGSYRFTCPRCDDAVEKRADRKIVALLVSAGVDLEPQGRRIRDGRDPLRSGADRDDRRRSSTRWMAPRSRSTT